MDQFPEGPVICCDQFGRNRATVASTCITLTRAALCSGDLPEGYLSDNAHVRQDPDGLDPCRRGEYPPLLALATLLDNGAEAKRLADLIIDRSLFNLRVYILKQRLAGKNDPVMVKKAAVALHTYSLIVC